MTDINWGLLGRPVDIAGAAQQGYEAGRLQRRRQQTEDVLASYASTGSQDALRPLAALDPQAYGVLSRDAREQEATRRSAQGRAAYATVLRERETGQAPVAAPAPQEAAPALLDGTATASDEILVTGRRPAAPAAPTTSIADVAEYDPDLAASLTKHIGELDENGREQFARRTGVAAAVSLAASHLPPDQRGAFLDSQAPLLKQAGWTDDQLVDFDPTDDNLQGMIAIGVGADKILADNRAAAGQAVTVRGQDVSASTTRRGQDISSATSRRGQDIGAATARAGQAVSMRGQDMQAASVAANRDAKLRPSAASITLAKNKLSSLNAITAQLDRAERALSKAKYTGPVAGRLPGGLSGPDDAADAALAGLSPLVRQLTRVPGEGAMSDYESRLAQAGIPSRAQTKEGRKESIDQLRALVNQARAGYTDVTGAAPASEPRAFKVVR